MPTDVIDTDLFTRMTPVRWWEPPVLLAVTLLTGLWFAIPSAGLVRGGGGVAGAGLAAVFAIGCPVCNKIIVGLLGVSGALGVWAPIQPALALMSLLALGTAVYVRWRRRGDCADGACATDDRPSVGAQSADSPVAAERRG